MWRPGALYIAQEVCVLAYDNARNNLSVLRAISEMHTSTFAYFPRVPEVRWGTAFTSPLLTHLTSIAHSLVNRRSGCFLSAPTRLVRLTHGRRSQGTVTSLYPSIKDFSTPTLQ